METLAVFLVVLCAFVAAFARLAPRSLKQRLPWLYRDVRQLKAPPPDRTVVSRIDVKTLKASMRKARTAPPKP